MRLARFVETLKNNLRAHRIQAVREQLAIFHEEDLAELMEELDEGEAALLFRFMPKDAAAEIFSYMSSAQQRTLIASFTEKEIINLVESVDVDVAKDFLEELPANFVRKLLMNTEPAIRKKINEFLQYKENSAGSVMSNRFLALRENMTVAQAIAAIREHRVQLTSTSLIYLLSAGRRLEGVLSLRELLVAEDDQKLADIKTEHIISVSTDTDQEEAVRVIQKYDFQALPVTDSEQRLVGIITHDEALDIAEEEAMEDFARMAALSAADDEYFDVSVWTHVKNRLPWLFFLLTSGLFNGWVLSGFEHALQAMTILVTFLPMLTGAGGNAGSQASTLIIRGIAVGEIHFSELPGVIWREFRTSLLVGLALGIFVALKVLFINQGGWLLAFVVSFALFLIIIFAKFLGGVLPLIAKRLGADPALMAAPLITTLVDTAGLLIYFYLAKLVFQI